MAKLLKGSFITKQIYEESNKILEELRSKNITPIFGVILVGDRKDSELYVRMKKKKCIEMGIEMILKTYGSDVDESILIQTIEEMNKNNSINGIMVQLPLPKKYNSDKILDTISPDKDVDGLTSATMGRLTINRDPLFAPCTARGVIELLKRNNITIKGANVVIIGKSYIVGTPLAVMFSNENATVSVTHICTKDIKFYTRNADIIAVATGVANLLDADWISEGVVIVDIGISVIELKQPDGSIKKKTVGDVNFESVKDKASAITPVPGGVGPITISILINNILKGAQKYGVSNNIKNN